MNSSDIKKIALIGAGTMGHGIAACCLLGGYTVILNDIKQEYIDEGIIGIRMSLEKFREKEKITSAAYDDAFVRLVPQVNIQEAVKDADFIVEAVPELVDLKKRIFKKLDAYAPKHSILASNTSNISISEIASATSRPENVIGYHFFNPAVLMKLVEVIKGNLTSPESIQIGYELAQNIGKVPVIVQKDAPGFIYNRVNQAGISLLSKILEEGHPTPEEFDAALKSKMPMAPFELYDYVGIDVVCDGMDYFAKVLSPDYAPSEAMIAYVKSGNLGKKTGRGFYDWSHGRPVIDPSKATDEYDIQHLIALQVNESCKIIEEKICTHPRDIDRAIASGSGSQKGPFAMAQEIGYRQLIKKLEDLHRRFKLDLFKPSDSMLKGNITV